MPKHNRISSAWLSLLPSALSVVLVGATLFAAATAWITVNRKTKSTGMQMTARTSANLVIADSAAAVQSDAILANGSPFAVAFEGNNAAYLPATHNNSLNAGASGTGLELLSNLQYVSGGKAVDAVTGQAKTGQELTMATVAYGDTLRYVDYTVYIASAGLALEHQTLTVTITATDTPDDTAKALSIDFYVKPAPSGETTYAGTLNLAGYDRTKTDPYNYAKTQLTLLTDATIPLNTATNGYITVLMRVYYDGALLKSANQAFVASASLTTTKMGITVNFTAE